MDKTDYIMRIIEQFAAFLWAIVFNKKAQNYDMALEKIKEAYNGLLFLDADLIKALSVDEIIESNKHNNIPDKDRIEIIANLFFEEADILERMNGKNIVSFGYYQKSIELFFILFNEKENIKYCKNIEEIIAKLENYEAGDEIILKIYEYYLKNNLYGKAEDKLYELLENDYPNIKDTINLFYENLLAKDDIDLEKGNLPRKEIIDAVKIFK
jgi:hypothetical protein